MKNDKRICSAGCGDNRIESGKRQASGDRSSQGEGRDSLRDL